MNQPALGVQIGLSLYNARLFTKDARIMSELVTENLNIGEYQTLITPDQLKDRLPLFGETARRSAIFLIAKITA